MSRIRDIFRSDSKKQMDMHFENKNIQEKIKNENINVERDALIPNINDLVNDILMKKSRNAPKTAQKVIVPSIISSGGLGLKINEQKDLTIKKLEDQLKTLKKENAQLVKDAQKGSDEIILIVETPAEPHGILKVAEKGFDYQELPNSNGVYSNIRIDGYILLETAEEGNFETRGKKLKLEFVREDLVETEVCAFYADDGKDRFDTVYTRKRI